MGALKLFGYLVCTISTVECIIFSRSWLPFQVYVLSIKACRVGRAGGLPVASAPLPDPSLLCQLGSSCDNNQWILPLSPAYRYFLLGPGQKYVIIVECSIEYLFLKQQWLYSQRISTGKPETDYFCL